MKVRVITPFAGTYDGIKYRNVQAGSVIDMPERTVKRLGLVFVQPVPKVEPKPKKDAEVE